MFGIEKNRVNILFYKNKDFCSTFINTYINLLQNDLNILNIYSDFYGEFKKDKKDISRSDDIEKYLEGKLFNIDIIVYNVQFYNKTHIDYLISLGITIIITFEIRDTNSIYSKFSKDFENLTYFIFECSADNEFRMMSRSMYFLNTEFEKNDFYLKSYQTDTKYSLYNWIDIQNRNNKLKKI